MLPHLRVVVQSAQLREYLSVLGTDYLENNCLCYYTALVYVELPLLTNKLTQSVSAVLSSIDTA